MEKVKIESVERKNIADGKGELSVNLSVAKPKTSVKSIQVNGTDVTVPEWAGDSKTFVITGIEAGLLDVKKSLTVTIKGDEETEFDVYIEEQKVLIAYGEFGFLGGTLVGYYNSYEQFIYGATKTTIKLGEVKNPTFQNVVNFLGMKDSEIKLTCELSLEKGKKYQKYLFNLNNTQSKTFIGGDTFFSELGITVDTLSIGYLGGQNLLDETKKEFSDWVTKGYKDRLIEK